ncbi:MAG: OadG family protein [Lachnospiraceae bacterium]|nr:OadG family protein [Lachnospiraceae bacterium]
MKKFARLLLMLTCVFVLTACGSDEASSEFQQSKETSARNRAEQVVKLTQALIEAEDVDVMLENYNNIELGDLFASTYAQYYSDPSFMCEGKAVNGALSSFQTGLDTMVSITEYGTPTSVVDGDTIIVTVPVIGEKENGSVELIFTNDIYLEMTSCTLNLDQTKGQLMTRAALNTLLGMGTVFVVLILISFIISAFGVIPKIQASLAPKKAELPPAPAPAPAPAAPAVEDEEEDLSDDMELVAVMAAAIAAYEGTSVEGFQVRSIRRASTKNWKK